MVQPLRGRLFVIGVDGVPPDLVRTAIDRGRAPAFAAIAERGLSGVVDVTPAGLPPLSPRIWTTYVTGQLPRVHGLKGFVYSDAAGEDLLYGSIDRKVPALWNIATQLGRSVGVVNWWATSPAEPVDGFVISDLYADVVAARRAKPFRGSFHWDITRVVYPAELLDELGALSPIHRKVGFSVAQAEIVDMNVFETASVALDEHPVEVVLVYVRAFDELAHMGWHTHEPHPFEAKPKRDVITDYLQRLDWLLGRFLAERVRDDDHLMILSDHGFERDKDPQKKGGTHESRRTTQALLMMAGPRLRRGTLAKPVGVLDVLPTMLELAGLPAAEDMPGRVVRQAFEDRQSLLPRVASYAFDESADRSERETSGDAAMKERLRALGYIDDDKPAGKPRN